MQFDRMRVRSTVLIFYRRTGSWIDRLESGWGSRDSFGGDFSGNFGGDQAAESEKMSNR